MLYPIIKSSWSRLSTVPDLIPAVDPDAKKTA
jgi:hypothetical protein